MAQNVRETYSGARETPRIRIVVADDNAGLRTEIQRSLGGEFEVLAAVADGRALIEAFDRLKPDVVVTDISMPLMDGFEAVAELRRRGDSRVVFFTVHEESVFFKEAKALGALGYVLKSSSPSLLAVAIRSAYSGQPFTSPEIDC
ncbi:MAG: response regulator transcription factor [Bryobacterales bacterium]|nr:response regulator transcription factor [Bryobacterales bacterium]